MSNTAASRLVLQPYSEPAVIQAARETLQAAGGRVSLGLVFASLDYQPHLPDFLELIQLHGHVPLLAGCSGSGLIGTGLEAEDASGFSLLLLNLPDTRLHAFTAMPEHVEEAAVGASWPEISRVAPEEVDAWLCLADPFGFPAEPWLNQWNQAYPGIPTLGGLSSGQSGGAPGEEIFLFHNRELLPPSSALLLGFKGGVTIETVVTQGCRPIGEPLTVTGSDGNLLLGIGGKPAYVVLAEAFESLTDEEKGRAQGNLFVGLASSEYVDDFKQGDFLIRTILGADASTGAVAIGAYPRVGQTLQWQLRDRQSAIADLADCLNHRLPLARKPFASLLFSCIGRGSDLFGSPNHDAAALAKAIGPVPGAGFFCNGEIGPVGGSSFVHGYTASIALFS